MQAVVKIGNSQYLVTPGQELLVTKQERTQGSLVFDQVLLLIDGPSVVVGQPTVVGSSVSAKILGTAKGDKVHSAIFKAKSRYRRVRGFRPQFTRLQVEDIKFVKHTS